MKKYLLPIYLFFILSTAIIFDYLFLFEMLGLSVFIFVFLLLIFHEIIRFIHFGKLNVNRYHTLALLILFFASIFFWRADYLVWFLAGFALTVLLPLYFVLVNHKDYFNKYSGLEIIELGLRMIIAPFTSSFLHLIGPFYRLYRKKKTENNNKHKRYNKTALKIFIALIISLPIFFIVFLLLLSADQIFAQFINKLIPDLDFNFSVFTFILALLFSLALWFALSGLVSSKILDKTKSNFKLIDRVFSDNIIPAIVINLLNIIYIIFSVIQFGYLFGGEDFVRSRGLVYSEYAIKGFWEMIFVVLINFCVLYFLQTRFSLKSKLSKIFLVPSYLITILASLLMVYSSHVRLIVYEDGYGFSRNRMIPHTFLIFIAVIIIILLFSISLKDERRRKFLNISTTAALILYFVGFCSFNMESFIVKENVERYEREGLKAELDLRYLVQDLGVEGLKTLMSYKDSDVLNKFLVKDNYYSSEWLDQNIKCESDFYLIKDNIKWYRYNYQYSKFKKDYENSGLKNLKNDKLCKYVSDFWREHTTQQYYLDNKEIVSGDYENLKIAVNDKDITGVYINNYKNDDNIVKNNCNFYIQGKINDSGEADILTYKQPYLSSNQKFIKGKMTKAIGEGDGINIEFDDEYLGCGDFIAERKNYYSEESEDEDDWQEVRIYKSEKDFLYEEPEENKKSNNYYYEYGDVLFVVEKLDNWLKVINYNSSLGAIEGWVKEEDLFPLRELQEKEYIKKEGIKYPVSKYEGTEELFKNEKYKAAITQEYLKANLDQKYLSLLDEESKKYIEEKKNEKVNFGGKYLAVYWGCGSECFSGSLINLENGKMYTLPIAQWGMKLNEESLIYIVDSLEEGKDEANKYRPEYAYPRYYYFNEKEGLFELLCNTGEIFGKENDWEGRYEYEEVKINKNESEGDLNSGKTMNYLADLFFDQGEFAAYIDIDGYYTEKRLQSIAKEEDGQLNFYFLEYLKIHTGNKEEYNEGDLLFSLIKQNGELKTKWGKLHPLLDDYNQVGNYFEKTNINLLEKI